MGWKKQLLICEQPKKESFVASLALDGYRIAYNCVGIGGYPPPPHPQTPTKNLNFAEFLKYYTVIEKDGRDLKPL
jgi:hypothetical protein